MNEAELRFRTRIVDLGGRVTEPGWLGSNVRHRIVCPVGHEAAPRPSDVKRGGGICPTCSGCSPAAAEQAFRNLVIASGGQVVEPRWLGNKVRHRIVCAVGHETATLPTSAARTGRICVVCSGREPGRPERLFRQRVAEAGGRVVEPKWLGTTAPHRITCQAGHHATPRPGDVNRGIGVCRDCGPTSPLRSEQEFRALVARLGGRMIEPVWLGSAARHRVICRAGHESAPRAADARAAGSICRTCTGHDAAASEREFRRRIAELGGRVVEPKWRGNKADHRVVCAVGHEVVTRPNNVQQGIGFCRFCAYKVWDVFYVVTSATLHRVKFGITSNGAKARLRCHRAAGYGTVVLTFIGLPDAYDLERTVLSTLAIAGIRPVHGREYYDDSALPAILDVAHHWPQPVRP